MQNYEVKEEVEIAGEVRAVGSFVELEDAAAAPLIEAGQIAIAEGERGEEEVPAKTGEDTAA